jgi:6-phosphogluconolactonase
LFSVEAASGKLTYVANYPTVTQPRGIKIEPAGRYLVASGEKSPEVAVYRIDPASGRLGEVGRTPGGTGANWVEIVDLP